MGGEYHAEARQRRTGRYPFYKEDASAVVTVKAGTVIQTERINGRVYELAITEDVVIASGTASALLPVKATERAAHITLRRDITAFCRWPWTASAMWPVKKTG